ncbi:DNA mismatch repair protein [Xylographa trunciseda]|nr:DNA mismatch repair protein [Xylographa trunciseda]
MVPNTRTIRPLPADVAAQIKSSTSIISLSHVVLGLIDNALDADATEIAVNVDFGRGACSVEDNGTGIVPADFAASGGLGKPYHTSYTGDQTKRLGRYGTFLSSLATLAILTVTSRHLSYNSTSTLIYHHSRAAARLIPAPIHHQLNVRSHGTRVQVQDLFGNMPVRVKQRPATDSTRRLREKEWGWLCKNITGLLLAWDSPICLIAQGSDKDQIIRFKSPLPSSTLLETSPNPSISAKSFNLDFIRNTLHTGTHIDLGKWNAWVKTSARTPFLTLRGIISLEPAPSKDTQFICLGLRYLTHENECSSLYDHVNDLFASSAFGVQEELGRVREEVIGKDGKQRPLNRDSFTQKQLKGGGKGVDRWPMFFIRIDFNAGVSLPWRSEPNSVGQGNSLSSITKVLEAMIVGYLSENHLRPRTRRTKKPKTSLTKRPRPANERSLTPSMPFQSPCNTVDVSIVEKPENPLSRPQVSKPATASIGDFVNNVRLPASLGAKSDGIRADFSGWSRIKGSLKEDLPTAGQDPNMIMPRLVSVQKCDILQQKLNEDEDAQSCRSIVANPRKLCLGPDSLVVDHRTNVVAATPGLVSGPGEIALMKLDNDLDDSDRTESGDMILTWTNPVSKATVKINSRTGSVIEDQFDSRLRGSSAIPKTNCRSIISKKLRLSATLSTVKPLSVPSEGSWAEEFLKSWDNPIFLRSEEAIPRVSEQLTEVGGGRDSLSRNNRSSHGSSERAFTDASISLATRLTKQDLRNAEIIAQLDKKFILIKVALRSLSHIGDEMPLDGNHVLVLVDQHAADERIRIETLLADLCVKATSTSTLVSALGFQSAIETTNLSKPIRFPVKARELNLFEQSAAHFAKWGILYNVDRSQRGHDRADLNHDAFIVVLTLPPAIAERCRVDVKHLVELLRCEVWKRKESDVQATLATNILCMNKPDSQCANPSEEIEVQKSWPELIKDCPQGIVDMLNSRSCRSAIMFNDALTLGECETLIRRLSACSFPFQCAHGRPSMVPLVNIDDSACFGCSTVSVGRTKRAGRGTVDFREAWLKSMAHL